MVLSKECFTHHLTSEGWVCGSQSLDNGQCVEVSTPSHTLLTMVIREEVSHAGAGGKYHVDVDWKLLNDSDYTTVCELLKEFPFDFSQFPPQGVSGLSEFVGHFGLSPKWGLSS